MDINSILYFLQTAKDLNYTRASEHLFISQPALSKSIHKLESELGVTLFASTPKGCVLTDYGLALQKRAQPIISDFNNLKQVVQDVEQMPNGKLNVGVPPIFASLYVADILIDFCEKYPLVDLHLIEAGTNMLQQRLADGTIDIAIGARADVAREGIEAILLNQDKAVVCINRSNPLAEREEISLSELTQEKFNLYDHASTMYEMVIKACVSNGFSPQVNIVSSRIEVLLRMVAANHGICILPLEFVQQYCTTDAIKTVNLQNCFSWDCCLLKKQHGYQPYITKLFEKMTIDYFQHKNKN